MNCASSAISRIVPTSASADEGERLSKYRKPKTVAKAVGSATLRSAAPARADLRPPPPRSRRSRCRDVGRRSRPRTPRAISAARAAAPRAHRRRDERAARRDEGSTPARRADRGALILFFTLSRDLPRDRRKGRKFAAGMPDRVAFMEPMPLMAGPYNHLPNGRAIPPGLSPQDALMSQPAVRLRDSGWTVDAGTAASHAATLETLRAWQRGAWEYGRAEALLRNGSAGRRRRPGRRRRR